MSARGEADDGGRYEKCSFCYVFIQCMFLLIIEVVCYFVFVLRCSSVLCKHAHLLHIL